MKTNKIVSIDVELAKRAKEEIDNFSAFVEDALRDYLQKYNVEDLEELKKELDKLIKSGTETYLKMSERIKTLKFNEKNRIKNIKKDVESCPELLNLTEEQIKDNNLLGDLVNMIRKKYNTRIGVFDIIEYYKIKNGE